MKHNYVEAIAPADKREEYNAKILALLGSGNMQGFAQADIFNLYSGLGGLHGLSRQQFTSFYDYIEAKKEIELGQFFTPPPLCEKIVQSVKPDANMMIADFTCGSGNFFNYLPTERNIYGCEIESGAYQVAKYLYPLATIVKDDFVYYQPPTALDLVIGNPPFNLRTSKGISQYVFIKKAAENLKAGGLLCFIAPENFLADEYTNRRKLDEIANDFDFIAQAKLSANWFNVGINTKVMYFQKKGITPKNTPYTNTYIKFEPDTIFKDYIEPLYIQNRKDAPKLRLLAVQAAAGDSEKYYQEKIIQYLFHIKQQKILNRLYYLKACDKIHQLKTQTKPAEMSEKDWRENMLTAETVARWMKKKVSSQYKPAPQKVIKLVKRQYDFKYKAYDKSLKAQETTEMIYSVLHRSHIPTGYERLMRRKIKQHKLMMQPYAAMEREQRIDDFLQSFQLDDLSSGLNLFGTDETIQLNAKQIQDCGLAFQKPFCILNWEQGGGKSIAGLAWISYHLQNVKQTFIAAPALAIQLTWKDRLEKYGYDYIIIERWQDLAKIQRGQVVALSFDMVRILERHLKRLIKSLGHNIAVLIDESDELTNMHSARTRATQNCFRKARKKILTTGTTTRNNINEIYPQLELLYNNSSNLMCWTERIFRPDKEGVLIEAINGDYGKPFPAWYGHNLFKYSFCPQKTSVFGVKRDSQDVFNTGLLKEIIERTVITRTFDDIVGKRIYQIKSHHVIQNTHEKKLYGVIIEEFYRIIYNYYTSTGNTRKESGLKLIRQINLLIKSSSIPHTLVDYDSAELPQKFFKIKDMLKTWEGEKVAIGTVFKEAAQEYYNFLEKQMPHRPLFYIDGEKSFNQRRKIIANFQRTRNGILISTQQSLKSSVDIEQCDKCIIEALQWNIPKMSQYYFRFIRYSSKNSKEVHFVTYADTIEQNILALLMSKQKLNEFIKTCELADTKDVYEDFDIDLGILDNMITKGYDKEGKLVLHWGKQTFSN